MIERYLVVLEDFMINEKLCILLNINEEFDRPTFINDLYIELGIIRQEFNMKDNKFIVLLDFSKVPYDISVIQEIYTIVNKVESHLIKNVDKFIIYKTNKDTDRILSLIEHHISRELFDMIVGDNNISDIINQALNDKNLLSNISHPVKKGNN